MKTRNIRLKKAYRSIDAVGATLKNLMKFFRDLTPEQRQALYEAHERVVKVERALWYMVRDQREALGKGS